MQHIILLWKFLTKDNLGYTKKPYSFLVNDTILSSHNPLRFRRNLLEKWVLIQSNQWQNWAKQSPM